MGTFTGPTESDLAKSSQNAQQTILIPKFPHLGGPCGDGPGPRYGAGAQD